MRSPWTRFGRWTRPVPRRTPPLVRKMHVVQAQLATARPFLQGLEGPAAAACLRAMQECEREVHNKAALSLDDILEDVDDEEKEE